jgi:predicted sugar kinase
MGSGIAGIETAGVEITSPLSSTSIDNQEESNTSQTPIFDLEEVTSTEEMLEQDIPEIKREQLDSEISPVVDETNQISSKNNLHRHIEKDIYANTVYEKKDTPEAINKLHELGLFPSSNNWEEIGRELNKFNKDALREMALLQLLGGVGAVAILEPSPLGEIAFGVTAKFVGKHSKIVQRFLKSEDIENISKSSISAGIKSAMSS